MLAPLLFQRVPNAYGKRYGSKGAWLEWPSGLMPLARLGISQEGGYVSPCLR